MKSYRKPVHTNWRIASMLVVFALMISSCSGSGTPTADVVEPTVPLVPSLAPEPTEAPISHKVIITLNPDITNVQAGDEITILLSFDPPIGVAEAKWEFVVGSGTIEPPEGSDAVVFTAPEDDEGAVIIKVSGQTSDGASFEQNFNFNIIPLPTPIPTLDCVFTAPIIPPPTFSKSSLVGTIISPERCETEIPVSKAFAVSGTASDIPQNNFLWLFVLASNGRVYPQCNDATKGLCGANYNGEVWGNPIYLGSPAYDKCKERFHLVLVSVDSDVNDFLNSEMTNQANTKNFVGFDPGELPSSIEMLASREVETAGNIDSCP